MRCTLVFLREDGRDGMSYELGHVSTPVEALRAYSSRACVPTGAWLRSSAPSAFRLDWDDGCAQAVWAASLAAAPGVICDTEYVNASVVDQEGHYVCWWTDRQVDLAMTWRKPEGWSQVKP